jgi:hypothetical protein
MTGLVDKTIGWCAASAIATVCLAASSRSFAADADPLVVEFQADCIVTNAERSALQALADNRGWGPWGPITDGRHEIGAGWHYTKDGRRFTVGVTAGNWERGDEPAMRGRPTRDCMVLSEPDIGALERMTALYGPGCPSPNDVPGFQHGVQWKARGRGYATIFGFSESSNRGSPRSTSIAVITAGSGPALTNLDMRAGC